MSSTIGPYYPYHEDRGVLPDYPDVSMRNFARNHLHAQMETFSGELVTREDQKNLMCVSLSTHLQYSYGHNKRTLGVISGVGVQKDIFPRNREQYPLLLISQGITMTTQRDHQLPFSENAILAIIPTTMRYWGDAPLFEGRLDALEILPDEKDAPLQFTPLNMTDCTVDLDRLDGWEIILSQ